MPASAPRKIRVLRVITWLPVGGIERKIVDVLPRLDRDRFDVSLVCLRERGPLADELEAAGIKVDLIPFRNRWDPFAMRKLAALMRGREIDVVHSHMYRASLPATVAARLAGVRRVWCQVHNVNTWETPRQLAMDRLLCRWRTGMVAVSEKVRADVIEKLRLPPERVKLLYNGVNLDRFGPDPSARAELRAEHGVPDDATVLLFAARLVDQKRPHDFLDLAANAVDRLSSADSSSPHLWMLGDGPMLDALRERAASLPEPDRIRFFGRRDDVNRFMAAADIFVQCSTKEGFSNAILEAMASGLAIVATDVGGNAEAIRDGQDGIIIAPGDTQALGNAIQRLLADPALRRSLGESARERAKMFSLEAMVRYVEALYRGEIGEG